MDMFLLPDYRVRQREYLLDISRALTAQLDPGEVLRLILSAATSMLSAEVGIIALREGEKFHIRAVIGIQPDDIPLFDPLLEDLPLQSAAEFDVRQFYGQMRRVARDVDLNLRQVVALPMIVADTMLGILFIFRAYAGSPTENDHRLLQSFADQAAIAVHNARMYEAANHERKRLAALLDHSADGVMILDARLRVERWNRALSRMTGWPAEQTPGLHHDVVIRWKRRDMGPNLSEAVRDGWPGTPDDTADGAPDGDSGTPRTLYVEGELERLDGTSLSVGITYAPLFKSDGDLITIIANVRDITHFREAEQLKSTFISVISHELKTPVALIKGYADTLNRDDAHWDAATIRNGLSVIEEEADRLTELIENLLAASKLQAEGMRLALTDIHLPTIVQQAIERLPTRTDRHTITTEFPPDCPVITGDETRLRQVIDNLLSNAVKYSPGGGDILVRGRYDANSVTISVSDQGPGLPPDQLERVFERFYRVEGALTKTTQGTGLGLYLAHAVITAHGGRIWAVNNLGGGATFSFTLPRR
ncbi:MAG: GAF domain-containing protein [Anaerolineae bacterium]|nr:GAF domain-containing protein [Anaerolineae bacterium]